MPSSPFYLLLGAGFGPPALEAFFPIGKTMQSNRFDRACALAQRDATSQIAFACVACDLENAWRRQLAKAPAIRIVGILREFLVQPDCQICPGGRSLQEENVAQTFPP